MTRLGRRIEEVPLHDFSGGFTPRLASTEFTERQWARLDGVVLESPAVLRSQWAWQPIGDIAGELAEASLPGDGLVQLETLGRNLIGVDDYSRVWTCLSPLSFEPSSVTAEVEWSQPEPFIGDPDDGKNIISKIAVPDPEGEGDEGFVNGVLVSAPNPTGGGDVDAGVVYVPENTWTMGVKTVSNRWVPDTPTENTMPYHSVGTMWRDFYVAGNVLWVENEDSPHGPDNFRRYPNALWFSKGGQPFTWDPLDVVFMPTGYSGRTAVTALIPIDAGLMVFTQAGLFLLRGQPDDFEVEPIAWNMGGWRDRMSFWPYTRSIAWQDNAGQMWLGHSEQFTRLDTHLFQRRTSTSSDSVNAWGEFLAWSHDGELLLFRAFDEDGAWTRIITPTSDGAGTGGAVRELCNVGDQLYGIVQGDGIGLAGEVWRLNRRDDVSYGYFGGPVGEPAEVERGMIAGTTSVEPVVATRTVEAAEGHGSTVWHRFGFRCSGPGEVESVRLRPGPALDDGQPHLDVQLDQQAGARHDVVIRGHGPSVEASAEIRFKGDVSVEQVSWWHHRGRGER